MASAWWPCLIVALLSSSVAFGFPRSPSRPLEKADNIEVYSTKVSCKVTSRFAHNVVTTRAANRANAAKDVSFDVELPKTAFITNFTLTIDGVTYPGNVKEKEVAKKQYEKAVSQGKTAGLVKASGRKLEKFTVSVNVAAGSKVMFQLTYEELLKRNKGKYEMYLKVQPKQLVKDFENVVFVIDISGSMSGRKIEQTRDALLKILEDIKEEDYLNFILFDSDVTTWKDTLVQATPENIQEAREFVKNVRDRGMTNINDGLLTGISMLNKAREEHTVPERSTSIVIMLTDRDANVGESRPAKIQENVLSAIKGRFPLYTLGFGKDLNLNLLESLALENDGFARHIYEDSDANLQLQVCLVLEYSWSFLTENHK
ncbi:Inter-alpha-trypsin inhibitor heavy chain H3 [Myotis brandtii]|uniref:Inter-alpha-trypsin inhibitor heavy chain H3 n=1 Tax=Myotis brandtii TaxID=109478 RepID=S7MZZ0_MYOBR|nr:Inter-alpha-trypsin inhibitor heavy chain H3 [Myotis brandtii]